MNERCYMSKLRKHSRLLESIIFAVFEQPRI